MDWEDTNVAKKVWGMHITPLDRRRWQNFRANRRGYWSLWIFLTLFFLFIVCRIGCQ